MDNAKVVEAIRALAYQVDWHIANRGLSLSEDGRESLDNARRIANELARAAK